MHTFVCKNEDNWDTCDGRHYVLHRITEYSNICPVTDGAVLLFLCEHWSLYWPGFVKVHRTSCDAAETNVTTVKNLSPFWSNSKSFFGGLFWRSVCDEVYWRLFERNLHQFQQFFQWKDLLPFSLLNIIFAFDLSIRSSCQWPSYWSRDSLQF